VAERRSILIFEYLLASSDAWKDASASMQREATSMLAALVSDFARLPDVRPVVLVASDARELVESGGHFSGPVEILSLTEDPADWLAHPDRDPQTFAATVVIAPECGGTLVSLLRQLQTGLWLTVPNLNVSWTLAEVFTDKFRTFQWLREHGFPTPATKAISVVEYNELRHRRDCQHLFAEGQSMPLNEGLGILKPRDGVGCDGVSLIRLSSEEFSAMAEDSSLEMTAVKTKEIETAEIENAAADRPWLIQKYVPGIPCSVGLIGGRGAEPATILPPALQNLRLENGHPVYCGGRIPCDPELQEVILPLAKKLASAVGPFSGYFGVDLVVGRANSGELAATVIEINPRLCTSYVGYRRATVSNLAGLILGGRTDIRIEWNSAVTEFEPGGQ